MRAELAMAAWMAGSCALGACATTNVAEDAPVTPDAGSVRDAVVATDTPATGRPDAFSIDAMLREPPDAVVGGRDATPRLDAAIDAGPTPDTIMYVVASYDMPDAPRGPRMDEAPGLNLDGRVSIEGGAGTCEDFIGDLVSPFGERGVDNQLVGSLNGLLAGFVSDYDLQRVLDDDVATGRRLLAIRVNDLDSFVEDADVRVDLLLVRTVGCASDACPPPGGVVTPGATWSRVHVPLASGLPGEVVGGRLRVLLEDFPLVFDAGGVEVTMRIRESVLEGDVSATGLDHGVIAGGVAVDDLVFLAETIMPGIGETARGILIELADLRPSPADPLACTQLSAGLGVTAVPGAME